jgi:enoyl-[acyl-carrier protein] reductase III
VRELGGSEDALAAEVGDPRDVRSLIDWVRAHGSELDAVVHSAALGRFQPFLDVRPAEWDIAFRTNARALLLLAREATALLRAAGGAIVALSSVGSQRYAPFYGAIGPSKAALEAVVRYLAVELAPRGVRVNAVCGGMIEGETLKRLPQQEVLEQAVLQRTPASRLGKPEEIAEAVMFLLSARASWIYGQTLVVDGGFSLT